MKQLKKLALIVSIGVFACSPKKRVDIIVHNAIVYTVDSCFSRQSAFAVSNGVFLEIGSDEDILSKYESENIINTNGRPVYPGFNDAHCHFLGYAEKLLSVDLTGTRSWKEVLQKCKDFKNDREWIIGRGWDQNDWEVKEFPTKKELDSLFPDKPVYLTRIDGHAAIANSKALELANINFYSTVAGGKLLKNNNELSGVLIDNAMELVKKIIPEIPENLKRQAILRAQQDLTKLGLTSIHDAGMNKDDVQFLDQMYRDSLLYINIYAMINPSKENLEFLKVFKPFSTKLSLKSIKIYSDGALGSRGALLSHPYHDDPSNLGLQLIPYNDLDSLIAYCYNNNLQVNTHSIGDSAARMVLSLYGKHLKSSNNRRWRIEHAQVINPKDFHYFSNFDILPSVQPTHATSDMPWAEDRLGEKRIDWSYSYNTLEKLNGIIPLGTDFPIENISPFYTFYAATTRKDHSGLPESGWRAEERLSPEQTLKGMTIDAAFASFNEKNNGSIEKNKVADFIILDRDILTCPHDEILKAFCIEVYIDGKRVYNIYPTIE